MSKRIQLRRGTATEHNAFTGAYGEVTVDTTNKTLRVHDGTTVGGTTLVKTSQLPVSASATTQGLIEIATQTEVNAGTDSTRAIVPNTLLGGMRTHLNASGTAPLYACRAWVNFNGTGTVAIMASGNVSSITDNGVGNYTVNLITAMPDANYVWNGTVQGDATGNARSAFSDTADVNTTTSFKVKTGYSSSGSSALQDFPTVSITVFR